MKRLFFLLFSTISLHGMAQYSPSEDSAYYTSQGDSIVEEISLEPSGSIAVGTSFSNGDWGEAFGTYVAPSIVIPVDEKLSLHMGAVVARYALDDWQDWYTGKEFNGNYASNTFWLGANYHMNDKLALGATLAIEENNFLNRAELGRNGNAQNISGTAQVAYKVNDKFRLFGSVTFRTGDGPFTPYGNNWNGPGFTGPGFNNFVGNPIFQDYYNVSNPFSPYWGTGVW
jgi:hypothetical protein